ncbi:hypothetical protein L596_002746 [Steinernema carpocapsae]|uniref:Tyrosinase copper-binding domain-containing protein n=1 Tax=Steinernema carpocapsae TaxID=34508 RepID=A0A4U8UQH4_STECR|nr:hypothetical protein L596_002746 [Steinernema carpocapsae]
MGKFELNGSTRELTDIDPVLYIWHDCLDGQTPCQRKVKLTIPKKFIHNGTPKPEQYRHWNRQSAGLVRERGT